MTADRILAIVVDGLMLVLLVSAIPVLVALIVGLAASLLQAATQVQEQTLSAVPKIVAVFLSIVVAGAWMLGQLESFAVELLRLVH